MIFTLIQMAAMILCGVFWRMTRPAGLAADQTRYVLTQMVYYLLLPALVLDVLWCADIGVDGDTFVAAVLETAMPCMVLGVVFCDRYRLDTSLYAMAVTLTTVLSMATLPLWHQWLKGFVH